MEMRYPARGCGFESRVLRSIVSHCEVLKYFARLCHLIDTHLLEPDDDRNCLSRLGMTSRKESTSRLKPHQARFKGSPVNELRDVFATFMLGIRAEDQGSDESP